MQNINKINLHISCPKTHVSGRVFTSTSTVGVQTNNTSKSAMLKFVRKIFVEFRISFVFNITIGTYKSSTNKKKQKGIRIRKIV